MKDVLEYPDLIVEVGINHNGSVGIFEKMIDHLAPVVKMYQGKVYIKTQKRTPELAVPKHMWNTPRAHPLTGEQMTYIEYKRQMEFDMDTYIHLAKLASSIGAAGFTASVWDTESVKFVASLNPPFLKIPSAMLTNDELVKACIATGIPIILSTGGSTLSNIYAALNLFSNAPLTLMVTTMTYPCPDREIGLGRMALFQHMWHDYDVGFSSHSASPFPAIYAGILGASTIEFHYTLDRTMSGSDHAASLELPAVELIARELNRFPELMKHDQIAPTESELKKLSELRK